MLTPSSVGAEKCWHQSAVDAELAVQQAKVVGTDLSSVATLGSVGAEAPWHGRVLAFDSNSVGTSVKSPAGCLLMSWMTATTFEWLSFTGSAIMLRTAAPFG